MAEGSLPIVDMSGLKVPGRSAEAIAVAEAVYRACVDVGFFYVNGHEIDQTIIDDALEVMSGFFHMPLEYKRGYAVNRNHRGFHAIGGAVMPGAAHADYKEFFQIGLELGEDDPDVLAGEPLRGPNQWPDQPADFRRAMSAYFDAVGKCGLQLLGAVALAFDLPRDFFEQRYTKPLQRTQGLYYPKRRDGGPADEFGLAPHTDYGCLTFLYQSPPRAGEDTTGGLEVQTFEGDWIRVPAIPGTFVINVGDLLQRWTNDVFRSTWHRVISRNHGERLSIATFFDPDFKAAIDPRDLFTDPGFVPRHAPTTSGAHILGRIAESFDYRQKLNA